MLFLSLHVDNAIAWKGTVKAHFGSFQALGSKVGADSKYCDTG